MSYEVPQPILNSPCEWAALALVDRRTHTLQHGARTPRPSVFRPTGRHVVFGLREKSGQHSGVRVTFRMLKENKLSPGMPSRPARFERAETPGVSMT